MSQTHIPPRIGLKNNFSYALTHSQFNFIAGAADFELRMEQ